MRFGAKILFKNVNLQFNPGSHYGLIGANGCGKSTFIKILAGEISPEKGSVVLPTHLSMGSLKQNHYLYEETPILDVVLMGKNKLWKALEKKQKLLEIEHFSEEACHQLMEIEKTIEEEGGYQATSEAAKLLEGLGIITEHHLKPLNILSGGYKLRVLLAQLFFGKPDILVLDEPTNHLDLFSIKWLEGYLRQFQGTLIVSSHDRDFLNGFCTHIVDVDYATIKIYKGNYEAFVATKIQDREQKEALLQKQDKRRADMQSFIDRFKAKATKARQAQSKARFVEQIEEEMEALDLTPSSRLYPKFRFIPYRPSGATALTVKGIAKSYGAKKVLENVSFEVERGDHVAIIGPNGIGKSTLIEILTDHQTQDEGSFNWGFAVRYAYFPQDHSREVSGSQSLLDWLGTFDRELNQEQLREILARVLFSGDVVNQSVTTLSGGETARLILAKMIMQKPNILIFDEPTNHLDMEAIDELTAVLQTFEETVIVVSHNRYFVSRVANRILEITPKGLKDFKCSYQEYMEKQEIDHLSTDVSLKQRYANPSVSENKDASSQYEDQKRMRNQRTQLKKKVSQMETLCQQLEEKIAQLDQKMATPGFYETASHIEQQQIAKQKQELEEKLMETLELWEEASLELQKVES